MKEELRIEYVIWWLF